MKYSVYLTRSAETDLRNLYDYISHRSGRERAAAAVTQISELFTLMASHPESGLAPRELQQLGITEFRQLARPPWRMIYSIDSDSNTVYVLVIADGRRDFSALLQQRLLR